MLHPGRVFSREQLLDAVWGHDVYVEARTVDVHIRRLRKALNADGAVDVVRTVRSAGYASRPPHHIRAFGGGRVCPDRTGGVAAHHRTSSIDDDSDQAVRGAARRAVSASAARNTAAVASSGAATQTSTPEAQARTAAGPTRSIAKMASKTGSGGSILGPRRKFVQQRHFPKPPRRAPARERRLPTKRAKVASKTFVRALDELLVWPSVTRSSRLIRDH